MFDQDTLNQLWANSGYNPNAKPRTGTQPKKKQKDFWTDQISTGTGIGGALGGAATGAALGSIVPGLGTAIGGLIGGIAGGALGSGGGELAENFVTGEEDKFKNVGQEALLGGVFSAPPIRLAKGLIGGGVAAARGGGGQAAKASLEQALTQPGMISQKLSNTLGRSADNLVLKSFNINDSNFLTAFKKNIGEDAGAFAKRLNFAGKSPEQITSEVYTPLQSAYKQAIANTNPIPKSDILKRFQTIYNPLLKSVANDQRALGQTIKAQADEIVKRLPNQVNAADAYDYKVLFDTLVDQKLTDSAGKLSNNVNKKIADAFRDLINKASASSNFAINPATLPVKGLKATNLQQLGKELQGILEFADKAAIKENVGRGRNVLGIPEVLGGVMTGGAFGNPLAAAGGLAATKLANSSLGERASMGVTERLGGALGRERNPFSIGGVTGRLGVIAPAIGNATGFSTENPRLEDALLNQDLSLEGMNRDIIQQSATNNTPAMNSNMNPLYQNNRQMSSPYSQENLMYDLQRDPANADKYIAYFQQLQEVFAPQAGADLSQSSRNALASADNAVNTVDQLQALYQNAGGAQGWGGNISNIMGDLGVDSGAKSYNSLANASVTQIAKALAGSGAGTVSDMDAKVIINALPTLQDTPEVAATKFAALRQRLEAARNNTLRYGGGTGGGLEDALLQAQGGF